MRGRYGDDHVAAIVVVLLGLVVVLLLVLVFVGRRSSWTPDGVEMTAPRRRQDGLLLPEQRLGDFFFQHALLLPIRQRHAVVIAGVGRSRCDRGRSRCPGGRHRCRRGSRHRRRHFGPGRRHDELPEPSGYRGHGGIATAALVVGLAARLLLVAAGVVFGSKAEGVADFVTSNLVGDFFPLPSFGGQLDESGAVLVLHRRNDVFCDLHFVLLGLRGGVRILVGDDRFAKHAVACVLVVRLVLAAQDVVRPGKIVIFLCLALAGPRVLTALLDKHGEHRGGR